MRFNREKELNGIIHAWYIEDYDIDLEKDGEALGLAQNPEGCYVVRGYVQGHPIWGDDRFRTSQVLTPKSDIKDGATIETLNSRYALGEGFKRDDNENKRNNTDRFFTN